MLEAIDHAAARDRQVVEVLRRCAPTWLAQFPWLDEPAERGAAHLAALEVTTRPWMLRELARLVDELAAREPLVLVLEDLHWADGETLDVLELLARRRDPARLLVVATYRPTEVALANPALGRLVAGLVASDLATRIALPPLSEADVRALATARLGEGRLGEAAAGWLVSWTAGNPLFVRTALDDLSARRRVPREPPTSTCRVRWRALPAGSVPATLEQLIAGQLDRLDPDDLSLLEAAAVVGGPFGADLVSAVAGADRSDVEDTLDWLASSTVFLTSAGTGPDDARYDFGHVAYRHVVAGRVARSRVAVLHLRAADWLEQAPSPERRDPLELAEHLLAGGDPGRAVRPLLAAAWASRRRFADRQALELFDRARARPTRMPDASTWPRRWRRAPASRCPSCRCAPARTPRPCATSRPSRRWWTRSGRHPAAFVAWQNLLLVENLAGRTGQVRRLAPVLLALATTRGRDRELMDAHHSMGEAELHAGSPSAALQHFDEAWAIVERLQRAQAPGAPGGRWLLDSGARIAAAQAGAALLAGRRGAGGPGHRGRPGRLPSSRPHPARPDRRVRDLRGHAPPPRRRRRSGIGRRAEPRARRGRERGLPGGGVDRAVGHRHAVVGGRAPRRGPDPPRSADDPVPARSGRVPLERPASRRASCSGCSTRRSGASEQPTRTGRTPSCCGSGPRRSWRLAGRRRGGRPSTSSSGRMRRRDRAGLAAGTTAKAAADLARLHADGEAQAVMPPSITNSEPVE